MWLFFIMIRILIIYYFNTFCAIIQYCSVYYLHSLLLNSLLIIFICVLKLIWSYTKCIS
jgi:hypothetical protein